MRYAQRPRSPEPLRRLIGRRLRERGPRTVATLALRYVLIHGARRGTRAWDYLVARILNLRAAPEFSYDGATYRYVRHHHNATWRNERAVELAIVQREVERVAGGAVLELGNVLKRYFSHVHDVVDKYEVADGVQNVDILDFRPERLYELIVSISTLEHVGWDEEDRNPDKATWTVGRLRSLLAPGGRAVVTVPLGHNPYLDAAVRNGTLGFDRMRYLRRTGKMRWHEAPGDEVMPAVYGFPFPKANAIMIAYLENDEPVT